MVRGNAPGCSRDAFGGEQRGDRSLKGRILVVIVLLVVVGVALGAIAELARPYVRRRVPSLLVRFLLGQFLVLASLAVLLVVAGMLGVDLTDPTNAVALGVYAACAGIVAGTVGVVLWRHLRVRD
jgi:ABC-type antimicrobial peptide transport system permease subunit